MPFSIPTSIPTEEHNGTVYVNLGKDGLKPFSSLKPEHIEEDELVRRLSAKAVEINRVLANFRDEIFGEVSAYRELLAEKYGVQRRGRKGNITLSTVDASLRLLIQVADTMTFGPELEVAKEIIDECIRRWSQGSNDNIRALVDQAFQVDRQGKINPDRILALRRLNMKDETGDWEKAMGIIGNAVRPVSSKEHARFYAIDPKNGDQDRIALDLANA